MIGVHTTESAEVGKLYEIRWHGDYPEDHVFEFHAFDFRMNRVMNRNVPIRYGTLGMLVKKTKKHAILMIGEDLIRISHDDPENFELFPITE